MSWTTERENKLKELWKKGHTASQIATMIGGTTRNAIIGKAHRLNLEARGISKKTSITTKAKTENNVKIKQEKLMGRTSRFKALLLDRSFPPEQPTKLEDLTDETCRWPLGSKLEPASFFCGRKPVEPKKSGKKFSYCELHLLYGYVSKSDKGEDQINEEEIPQFIEKKVKSA